MAIQIACNIDTSKLDKLAKNYQRNLAYSTAQAINASGLEAQKRIRENLRLKFHVRKQDILFRSIKITAFANAKSNRPYLEIGVDNSKARLMLSLYESGAQKQPWKGKNVAVPITGTARPGMDASVNPALTFQALNFKRGPVTKRGKEELAKRKAKGIRKKKLAGYYYVWQGNQRTFILPHSAKATNGAVFQRVGPGRDDIRILYAFKQNVRIRATLDFVKQSEEAFRDVFLETFYQKFYRLNAVAK